MNYTPFQYIVYRIYLFALIYMQLFINKFMCFFSRDEISIDNTPCINLFPRYTYISSIFFKG